MASVKPLNIKVNPILNDSAFAAVAAKIRTSLESVVGALRPEKVAEFGNEFEKLQTTAKATVESQKAALAGFIATGQGSSAAAAKIRTELASSTAEAKKLADAVAQVDKELADAGKSAGSGGMLSSLKNSFKEGKDEANAGSGAFAGIAKSLGGIINPVGAVVAAVGLLVGGFTTVLDVGKKFETGMAAVSAITGLQGESLDDIGNRAQALAAKFGGDASTQLTSFQGVLSRFGADLAKTPEHLGKVSESINILAKAGGIDAATSMDTLTTAMLQFGVNTSNSSELARESSRFINVMAASARVGAAEIPQVGEAIRVAGVAMKGAKVSFEQGNAAIQVLAAGGKVGAEAGTALRNVLGKLAGEEVIPKDARAKLKSLGVDMKLVSDTTKPFSDRLKELAKASGDATAFTQVFGSENAAAATILAQGAGTVEAWTKEITGTSDATTQAAVNMNTLSERLSRGKAIFENFAIDAFKALSPIMSNVIGVLADSFSQVQSALAPALVAVGEALAPIGVVVAAVFGGAAYVAVKAITAGVVAFANGLRIVAPVLGVVVTAFGLYALFTNAAAIGTAIVTTAQWAWNAAMLANPIGLIIAGAVAAVVAIGALTDALSVSSQEALENAESQKKVVEVQIQDNNEKKKSLTHTQSLVAEFENLSKKTNTTAAEQKRLREIQSELDKQYPKLIDQTKSFAENLNGVQEIGKSAAESMQALTKQGDALQKQLAESVRAIAGAKRNVAIDELRDSMKDFGVFGGEFRRGFIEIRNELEKGLFSAKNNEEVDAAAAKVLEYINANRELLGDAEKELELRGAVSKAIAATRDALAAYKGEVVDTAAKETAAAAAPKATKAKLEKEKSLLDEIRKVKRENAKIQSDIDAKEETDEAERSRKAAEEKTANLVLAVKDEIEKYKAEKKVSEKERTQLISELNRKESLLIEQGYSERNALEIRLASAALSKQKQSLADSSKVQLEIVKDQIAKTKNLLKDARDTDVRVDLTSKLGAEEARLVRLEGEAEIVALEAKNKELIAKEKELIEARAAQKVVEYKAAQERAKNQLLGIDEVSDATKQAIADAEAHVAAMQAAFDVTKKAVATIDEGIVNAARDSQEKQTKILQDAAEKRRQILLDSSEFYRASLSLQASFEKQFSDDTIAQRRRIADESKKSIKSDEDALFVSLKNRTIDEKGYYSAQAALDKKRAESASESVRFIDVANAAFIESTQASAADAKKTAAGSAEALKKLYAQDKKEGESAEKFEQDRADARKNLISDLATSAATSFVSMVASGKNAADALIGIVIDSAVTLLNAMIPTWIAGIFGSSLATLGPVGLGVAAVATAALTALASAAKSALIGADKGVVGITKDYSTKPSKRDVFPILIREGETVINTEATDANREVLQFINTTNRPAQEFFSRATYDSPEIKKEHKESLAAAAKIRQELQLARAAYDSPEIKKEYKDNLATAVKIRQELQQNYERFEIESRRAQQNFESIKPAMIAVSVNNNAAASIDRVVSELQRQTELNHQLLLENRALRAQQRQIYRSGQSKRKPQADQAPTTPVTHNPNW